MADLHEIRPDQDIQRKRRKMIVQAARSALRASDGKLGGFALVTWDNRGETGAWYCGGSISSRLVPTLVHDELNRAVAIHMVEDRQNGDVDGAS